MQNIRSIVLGITGGIAAYKAAELVRLLVKAGINVHVVMTEAASHFITATTLQALSGHPVHQDLWNPSEGNGMAHIGLSREVDAILIAPCSANFMAKLALGLADDLLSTLCLARDCPLYIAPAMNKQMWEHAATQRNAHQLNADGVWLLGPDAGEQACGEVGLGRMLEPEALLNALMAHQQPKLFAGKRFLITAGATYEHLDPVRALTNLSSGKMGFHIAQVASHMGAEVTLVYGKVSTALPTACRCLQALSAQSMYETVMREVASQDFFISVAAVADYRPKHQYAEKIKKSAQSFTLELVPNPDILSDVASLPNPPYCVGFAAESQDVVPLATEKRLRKRIPMIVANSTQAMEQDENELTIIDDRGVFPLPRNSKQALAHQLLEHLYHTTRE